MGLQKKIQANRIVPKFQELLISPIITKNFSYTQVEISTNHFLQVTSLRCTGLPDGFWLLEFRSQWLSPLPWLSSTWIPQSSNSVCSAAAAAMTWLLQAEFLPSCCMCRCCLSNVKGISDP